MSNLSLVLSLHKIFGTILLWAVVGSFPKGWEMGNFSKQTTISEQPLSKSVLQTNPTFGYTLFLTMKGYKVVKSAQIEVLFFTLQVYVGWEIGNIFGLQNVVPWHGCA